MYDENDNPYVPPAAAEAAVASEGRSGAEFSLIVVLVFVGFICGVAFVQRFQVSEVWEISLMLLFGRGYFIGWGIIAGSLLALWGVHGVVERTRCNLPLIAAPLTFIVTLATKYALDGSIR